MFLPSSRTATFKHQHTLEYLEGMLIHGLLGPVPGSDSVTLVQGLRNWFSNVYPCDTPAFALGTLL